MTEPTPVPVKVKPISASFMEATIESKVQGGTESTCNHDNNAESSGIASTVDREKKTVEFADELTEKGSKAFREHNFKAYYQYGRALLYKAQEEEDPLVSIPKKEGEILQDSNKEGSTKSALTRESSIASVSSNTEQDGSENDEESGDSDTADEAQAKADEDADETELDLAWKMLDIA